jgi:hypothetical protein
MRPARLWNWTGTIDRTPYLLLGVTLLVVKFGLDWLVAAFLFDRSWSLLNYLALPGRAVSLLTLPEEDRLFYGMLLVLAVPFIWAGVALTVRRLRAARLPLGLVLFFFVPVVNLVLFVALCLVKSCPANAPAPAGPDRDSHVQVQPPGSHQELDRRSPASAGPFGQGLEEPLYYSRFRNAHLRVTHGDARASAAVALAISVPLALGSVLLGVFSLRTYGWGLFVGMPFCLGMVSVLLYGLSRPQPLGDCLKVALLATTLTGLGILGFALEGLICLLMAAPIGYALAILGALIGYAIQARPWSSQETPYLLLAVLLTLPGMMGAESFAAPEPAIIEVCSVVEIDAPPEVVWRHVIAFPELPEPDEWYFRAGVAYPIRAHIAGRGPGAVRHCVFSTGTFVEPIDVWDAPKRLRFRVTDQPPPLREWSPFDIHPPHLDHYLVSHRGQFHLVPLPGGRTRLEGTTWYSNHMWPAAYWQLWSDAIIHRIHLRVLRHIRGLAEQEHASATDLKRGKTP